MTARAPVVSLACLLTSACGVSQRDVVRDASAVLACPASDVTVTAAAARRPSLPEDVAEDPARLAAFLRSHPEQSWYMVEGCGRATRFDCTRDARSDERGARWTEWRCSHTRPVAAVTPSRPRSTRVASLELELAGSVQRGVDPPEGQFFSKGCFQETCGRTTRRFAFYGVGIGARAGLAALVTRGPLRVRPYLGVRYERYFETPDLIPDATNAFSLEAGVGVGASRIELRPLAGVGLFVVPGAFCESGCSAIPFGYVGFALTARLPADSTFGTYFHFNFAPAISPLWIDSGIAAQTLDAPVLGLELGWAPRVLGN